MLIRRAHALALAVVSVGVLAGCGADPAAGPQGVQRTPRGDPAEHNQTDVEFAQMMLVHTRQALTLADLARERSDHEDLLALVDDLAPADEQLLGTMTGLLEEWDEPVPDEIALGEMDHSQMDHQGIGMAFMAGITDEQLTLLTSQDGNAFDGRFLRFMLRHRGAAVAMAQSEKIGGQFGEALAIAKELEKAQEDQMDQIYEVMRSR